MYLFSPKSHIYWPSPLLLWSRFSELSEMLSSRLGYSPYFAPNKTLLTTLTLCFSFQPTLAYEAWLATLLLLCQTPLQETLIGSPRLQHSVCVCVLVVQSCPTLYDPTNYSPPGFSVHGIPQARILEWIATPFSRGSRRPRDRTLVSCISGRFFTVWATGKSSSTQSPSPISQHADHSLEGIWLGCFSPVSISEQEFAIHIHSYGKRLEVLVVIIR